MATTKITSPDLFNLESLNTALKLPSGTTAQRPTSPSTGEWRYNTTTNLVEFWDGGAWRDLQSEDIPPIPSENFNTVIWDGDSTDNRAIEVGFQPDMVWYKTRTAANDHNLSDSTRGAAKQVRPNRDIAEVSATDQIKSFTSTGFTVGTGGDANSSGNTYVAWCWKAGGGTTSSNTDGTNITSTVQVNAKAGFSIVQFTTPGTFNGSNTVGHGLGSTPDAIFVKRTDGVEDWYVYHQAAGLNKASRLNSTINYANATYLFGTVNSTVFNPNYTSATSLVNIAYCFKSIAGYSKFGSYTGNGTTQVVNTGFKPGWIMIKSTVGNDNWRMYDTTRGISAGGFLKADSSAAKDTADAPNFLILSNGFEITAGGTTVGNNANGNLYTYYAFAADASAAPTLPDSFGVETYQGNGGTQSLAGYGFTPSMIWFKGRTVAYDHGLYDSVRGGGSLIYPSLSQAASTVTDGVLSFDSSGVTVGSNNKQNASDSTYVGWAWKANPTPTINTDGTIQSLVSANQAAGFSIVSYTGDGANGTVGHGLGVAPEIVLVKRLNSTSNWSFNGSVGGLTYGTNKLLLNSTDAITSDTNEVTAATSTTFTAGTSGSVGASGGDYITYCFTSISGFSKIGSYTGNGSTQSITGLGFQPSWVLIKETSAAESWRVFDSARGATKRLFPNTNSAESTAADSLTAFDSDGFSLGSSAGVNENTQTYLYMAFKENLTPYPLAGNMSFLVVAGGASGGADVGGGGGAGGLRTSYGSTSGGGASAESDITLAAGTYTITVGAGGAAATGPGQIGNSGVNSSLAASGITTITSTGGGGGGATNDNGLTGGSGGGSGRTGSAGAGTSIQGYAGGIGSQGNTGSDTGGGGGGSFAIGANGTTSISGAGGDGVSISITGSTVAYAGGGGGGAYFSSAGTGGSGGGGAGGQGSGGAGAAGTTNLGAGGGGGGAAGGDSGAGGSGVAILRMNTTDYSGVTTGSPTVTTNGSYTILTYTGSGTYVHS